ncbi:uncharacterized protein LOC135925863 isoform X6 [Gordionus sp. m RMFG-2023]|uniref:uncharacterized protein LOC135925863 isoform X6 n=1 Tax=Gordionus sp. m RMFG-2023 TaxID=3053472 RepID=UPI0031FBB584
MESMREKEESLREYACIGDIEGTTYLANLGINVNSQNSNNGWTALHWACKRNHLSIVALLLKYGADKTLKSFHNQLPHDLTYDQNIINLLNTNFIIKARIADSIIHDFVEIHLNHLSNQHLTLEGFGLECLKQLITSNLYNQPFFQILTVNDYKRCRINMSLPLYLEFIQKIAQTNFSKRSSIQGDKQVPKNENDQFPWKYATNFLKIRKLPNTVLTKNQQLSSLESFQEIELILDTQFYETILKTSKISSLTKNDYSPDYSFIKKTSWVIGAKVFAPIKNKIALACSNKQSTIGHNFSFDSRNLDINHYNRKLYNNGTNLTSIININDSHLTNPNASDNHFIDCDDPIIEEEAITGSSHPDVPLYIPNKNKSESKAGTKLQQKLSVWISI